MYLREMIQFKFVFRESPFANQNNAIMQLEGMKAVIGVVTS